MSVIDEIKKFLAGQKPEQQSLMWTQILADKELYDSMRKAGLDVSVIESSERGLQRPYGAMSKVFKVDLVDLITEITNIKNIDLVAAITNIANIASLDLVDRIALIDSITAITNIANIANIASVDLIDRITLIDTITTVGSIGKIGNITDITANAEVNYIRNGGFETGTFDFWSHTEAYVTITTASNEKFRGGVYGCKNVWSGSAAYYNIAQFIPNAPLSDDVELVIPTRKVLDSDAKIKVFWGYTDGTTSVESIALAVIWQIKIANPIADKRIYYVGFCNDSTVGTPGDIFYDEIQLRIKRSKSEREDLLLKDFAFITSVDLQPFLVAVAGQKHKVYAYGYEADADGTYYFSATVNGAAWKFGRRITKGLIVQTLVHPIVCDVNTALNFMCTTGNSKVWVQYKTEA